MLHKELTTQENKKIYRVSRWIKIQHNYNVGKHNSLYYYATDENGYRDGQTSFDPKNGLYLDYFRWNGRTWAIEQFLRLSFPIFFEENGKTQYIAGYDSENYYNPILIEIDEYGEYVRIYEEGKE